MSTRPALGQVRLGQGNRMGRAVWSIAWTLLFRPSPVFAHGWRRFLLRVFGARVDATAVVYPNTRIWAPWNLEMRAGSCLARDVDCYCVAPVLLEERALVSQYAYLCTASHDHALASFPLIAAPIVIGRGGWVCASVFVGPGVRIGEGGLVGAASAVFKDVEPWTIVGGNPAKFIKPRDKPQ